MHCKQKNVLHFPHLEGSRSLRKIWHMPSVLAFTECIFFFAECFLHSAYQGIPVVDLGLPFFEFLIKAVLTQWIKLTRQLATGLGSGSIITVQLGDRQTVGTAGHDPAVIQETPPPFLYPPPPLPFFSNPTSLTSSTIVPASFHPPAHENSQFFEEYMSPTYFKVSILQCIILSLGFRSLICIFGIKLMEGLLFMLGGIISLSILHGGSQSLKIVEGSLSQLHGVQCNCLYD